MPAADVGEGPYAGTIYAFALGNVHFTEGYELHLIRSRTEGRDWTRSVVVSAKNLGIELPPDRNIRIGLQTSNNGLLISSTGKLYFFFTSFQLENGEIGKYRLWMTTSDDGGATFGKPRNLLMPDGSDLMGSKPNVRDIALAIDASKGPYNDRLYLMWENKGEDKLRRQYFSYSSDNGMSWEKPKPSPIQITAKPEQFYGLQLPTIAVNKDGVMTLAAYRYELGKWQADAKGKRYREGSIQRMVTASLDGGGTFLSPTPLASSKALFRSVDHESRHFTTGVIEKYEGPDYEGPHGVVMSLGDYQNSVAAADGKFHALWLDARDRTTQIRHAPYVVKCGNRPAIAGAP